MDPPRTPAWRHRHARPRRNTDRDRPTHNTRQDLAPKRGAEINRPAEVDTAQKPRQAHPRGSRGLHQRGQVDTDEPAEQKRRVCREQAVRHARHHRAQSDHRKSAVSAHRHRRVYPQTPDTPCGLLQIDSRRGARSRPAAACGRHLPSQLRGTDRSCQPYACRRVRIGRQADDHGVQQGRRLHLHAQGCRRPHSGTPREPVARRPEAELDEPHGRGRGVYLRTQGHQHRRTQTQTLRARQADTPYPLPLQRLPVSDLRQSGRRGGRGERSRQLMNPTA